MKQIEHLEKDEPMDDPEGDNRPRSPPTQRYYGRYGNRGHYRYRWYYQSSNFDFESWNSTAHEHNSSSSYENTFFSFGGDGEGGSSQRTESSTSDYFPFDRRGDKSINKTEGERWVRQAEVDYNVLCEIHSTANSSNGYAHVCFMAHQVAEKALKGGVYALCGLDGRGLIDHNLSRHSYALQAAKPGQTIGLAQYCVPLESYYLKTRYPNRWPGPTDIPSDHYTEENADQAKEHAEAILNIVKSILE